MKISGFNHIGINIKHLEETMAFYQDVLNLTVQKKVSTPDYTIIYLLLENGERIELFDYQGQNEILDRQESIVGYRHIAIGVDDVDAWAKHLIDNNVPILFGPADLPDLGVRVVLFEDPNGVELEFCAEL